MCRVKCAGIDEYGERGEVTFSSTSFAGTAHDNTLDTLLSTYGDSFELGLLSPSPRGDYLERQMDEESMSRFYES